MHSRTNKQRGTETASVKPLEVVAPDPSQSRFAQALDQLLETELAPEDLFARLNLVTARIRGIQLRQFNNGELQQLISNVTSCRNSLQGIETFWVGEANERARARRLAKAKPDGGPKDNPPPLYDDPVVFPNPHDLLEKMGESSLRARTTVERARTTTQFSLFGTALRDGSLRTGFMDVLTTQVGKSAPLRNYLQAHLEQEAELLAIARTCPTPLAFGKRIRTWAIRVAPAAMEKETAKVTHTSRLAFFAKPDGTGWKLNGNFDDIDGHHLNAWFNSVMGRKALSDHRGV
ncbi:hypothetical protein [Actinobaculum massiliense]|uniref:DUF222 domain-containing protein n=1 Tax=Actinobaculum massiliense ACS-171-V-Col2 TaxID=883066 RepID=K9EBT5_9ACTO|nr:hypothetical protein [Actinobaculum massiliense]EKU94729.1 hypothetical protein HMPREF9233_01676 [Actinobaculum massiliense ACS-171-V-Col2]MDK8319076.1 hypothetical protein [Actinobaculum massiliense]MDK8567208.1 hypothetical protein [Actinobaculum massiliense]